MKASHALAITDANVKPCWHPVDADDYHDKAGQLVPRLQEHCTEAGDVRSRGYRSALWVSVPVADIVQAAVEHVFDFVPLFPTIRDEGVRSTSVPWFRPGGTFYARGGPVKGGKELAACFPTAPSLSIAVEVGQYGVRYDQALGLLDPIDNHCLVVLQTGQVEDGGHLRSVVMPPLPTSPAIRYCGLSTAQVRLVDELLTDRLRRPLGFADLDVTTLDPAVGTGTYLLSVIEHALAHNTKQP